jgi:hypothetical protein
VTLDINAEINKIREYYEQDSRQNSFNALVLGESGSGKTFLARTARRPVHIDSFDPGGTKCLKDLIDSGDIVADTRWESEDPLKPSEFKKWKKDFEYRRSNGYFEHFGTYILDSATTWSDAIMNYLLAKDGIAGEAPRFTKDYTPQKIMLRNYIFQMCALPCDFILTGHLKLVEDPDKGTIFRFMTTGQGMVTIPLLFDEIYVMSTKEKSSGTEYTLLTQSTKLHMARSRMSKNGLLLPVEKPDIKALLKKAGLSCEDKPKLGKGGEQ